MMISGVKLVILFGSRAAGSAGPRSDFDVGVLADHQLNLQELSAIKSFVSEKLNAVEDSIDLVDLWNAPPLLWQQIASTGKLLWGNDFDFLRFKVLAWKRYQDTAKFRRLRETALKARYAE